MVVLSDGQMDRARQEGMYLPQLERDNCGVGFVSSIKGVPTNRVSFAVVASFRTRDVLVFKLVQYLSLLHGRY